MLVSTSPGDSPADEASHSVTLVPRLEYCANLLDRTVMDLEVDIARIRASNQDACDPDCPDCDSVDLEWTAIFSLEALLLVRERIRHVSQVGMIPGILSPLVPVLRAVGARLHRTHPDCCQNLSRLSIHLGSIVLDSAALTRARFDFAQSFAESSAVIDKVKLMADSKISKQYPNLDTLQPNTN